MRETVPFDSPRRAQLARITSNMSLEGLEAHLGYSGRSSPKDSFFLPPPPRLYLGGDDAHSRSRRLERHVFDLL